MTNSGVPQFPQPGQYRPDNTNARSSSDNSRAIGNLDRAPDEIRREITERRQDIRTQGEVIQVSRDGNVRIATPRGDVDVQLPPDQPRPQVGQRVEITIAQPQPDTPAQVTVRPAAQDASTRPSATPVQIEVRGEQPAPPRAEITPPPPNASPPANRFPEAGSLVRLDPVSPDQLKQLVETRQLVVTEVVRNVATPAPVADVLPASPLSGTMSAQPVAQPSAQVLDIPQAPINAQSSPQNSLPTIVSSFVSANPADNALNVPVLNRAQAAIAQLQNAASNALSAGNNASIAAQDVRVNNIQPQNISQSVRQNAIIGTQNAAQISGTVIAKTQNQVPIVQFSVPQNAVQALTNTLLSTPLNGPIGPIEQQTYMLQFPSDALLLGSRIDVTPQAPLNASTLGAQPSALNAVLAPLPFANIAFAQSWPAFQDMHQTLIQSTAQNAAQTAQAFSNVIPSPANASQFGPAALLFIAAARGGDLGSWLSDKASEILRQSGKSSLLSRISSEASGISRGAEAPSSEWRGMNIPLMWDGDIQKIALHYRHDSASGDDEDQSSSNKGTRFIFDLNLDVMGKVQLDGFFRPVSSDGPRLDVVLRTEERFSGAMQAEMRRVYMDAIKPSQVGGELSFQDGTDAWVMIDAEDAREIGVNA